MKKVSVLLVLSVLIVIAFASIAFASSADIQQLKIVKAAENLIKLLKYLALVAGVCFLAGAAFCFVRGGEATQWVSTCFTGCLVCGSVWGGTEFITWLMGDSGGAVIDSAVTIIQTSVHLIG